MHCVCQHLSLPPQVVLHSAASVSDSSMSSRQPCASELRAVCRFRFQFDLAVRQHVCQIDGKLSPTSCAMFLVSVCVCVCVCVCVKPCQTLPPRGGGRSCPSGVQLSPKICALLLAGVCLCVIGSLPREAGCALAPAKPCQTLPPRGGGRSVRDPSREPRPRSGRPSVWHDGARVAALPTRWP